MLERTGFSFSLVLQQWGPRPRCPHAKRNRGGGFLLRPSVSPCYWKVVSLTGDCVLFVSAPVLLHHLRTVVWTRTTDDTDLHGWCGGICSENVKVAVTFLTEDGERAECQGLVGENLLDVAIANNIDIEGACGGTLACSTCHLYIDEAFFDKYVLPPCFGA